MVYEAKRTSTQTAIQSVAEHQKTTIIIPEVNIKENNKFIAIEALSTANDKTTPISALLTLGNTLTQPLYL